MKPKKENNDYLISTPKGNFGAVLDKQKNLKRLLFPNQIKYKSSMNTIQKLETCLKQYLQGKKIKPPFKISIEEGTPFQQKVWKTLKKIPYGQTRSYAWVARQIGKPKAVRAVGTACGKNPVPIFIPCHRVLQSKGGLGGFTSGLSWKKYLLNLEQQ